MPGIKPKEKISRVWSPELAYAIGLLTTDGNLSKDSRHIDFTSKDFELVEHLRRCLQLKNKISKKTRGGEKIKKYYRVQFGDVLFYKFLIGIGLSPAKSKILNSLDIPEKYFFDFLRGHFDGDGTFYSYYDPRWKSSFMFYTVFTSASFNHLNWIRGELGHFLGIKGHVTHAKEKSTYQLKYAKSESMKLLKKLYYLNAICLERKKLKINKALNIINQC